MKEEITVKYLELVKARNLLEIEKGW